MIFPARCANENALGGEFRRPCFHLLAVKAHKRVTPRNVVLGVRQNSSIVGFCLFFRERVSRGRGTLVSSPVSVVLSGRIHFCRVTRHWRVWLISGALPGPSGRPRRILSHTPWYSELPFDLELGHDGGMARLLRIEYPGARSHVIDWQPNARFSACLCRTASGVFN